MPAVENVVFTGNDADAYLPTYLGSGVWELKAPDNAELVNGQRTIPVNYHIDITVPSGHHFMIFPSGTNTSNAFPHCGIWDSPAASTSLTFNYINCQAGNITPTGGAAHAYIMVYPNSALYKCTDT